MKVIMSCNSTYRLRYWNFRTNKNLIFFSISVATVLTVYGIETIPCRVIGILLLQKLQQYLPFTVLKLKYSTCKATY